MRLAIIAASMGIVPDPQNGSSNGRRRSQPEATINAAECDVVVTGTPIDLGHLITSHHPIRHVRYELEEVGSPTLADVLEPIVVQAKTADPETVVTG